MPIYFSAKDDIILLREAIASGMNFVETAKNVSSALNKFVSRRTTSDRVERLVGQYEAKDMANLRKSGTEEDYEEKEQLLQECADMLADVRRDKEEKFKEKTARRKSEHQKEEEGKEMRKTAMERMKRHSNDDSDEDVPIKRRATQKSDMLSDFLQVLRQKEEASIDIEKKKLELEERRIKLLELKARNDMHI